MIFNPSVDVAHNCLPRLSQLSYQGRCSRVRFLRVEELIWNCSERAGMIRSGNHRMQFGALGNIRTLFAKSRCSTGAKSPKEEPSLGERAASEHRPSRSRWGAGLAGLPLRIVRHVINLNIFTTSTLKTEYHSLHVKIATVQFTSSRQGR